MKSFHWRYNYVGFHSSNFVEIMFVFIYFLWNQGEQSGRNMAQPKIIASQILTIHIGIREKRNKSKVNKKDIC